MEKLLVTLSKERKCADCRKELHPGEPAVLMRKRGYIGLVVYCPACSNKR